MSDAAPWLMGSGALGALAVALIDFAAALYLFKVWWLSRRAADENSFAALPLALFFSALSMLALSQMLMKSSTSLMTSFYFNCVAQSASALLSGPPIVYFAYSFIERPFAREGRIVGAVVLGVTLSAIVVFVLESAYATPASVVFDFHSSQARNSAVTFFVPLGDVAPLLFCMYSLSLLVLVRKWWRLRGRRRHITVSFALVIVLGMVAMIVNRFESGPRALPVGTYSTVMLWSTLSALMLFALHSDEITRFHDRITALVLVMVLAATAVIAQRSVAAVEAANAQQRRQQALAVVVPGEHPASVSWSRLAVPGESSEDIVGTSPADAVILEVVPGPPAITVAFSQLHSRRAVDAIAFPAALAMVLAAIVVMIVVPPLAELTVLRPLLRLERADADSRAKSVFLAAMSHELKTPLNAILHHARVLAEFRPQPVDVDVDVAQRAQVVATSAEHLLALIEALLGAARNEAVKTMATPLSLEATDVSDLVADVVAMHRPAIERQGLAVDVVVSAPHAALLDRRMLRQVLSNLLGNAVKYTPSGRVSVRAFQNGPRLRFVVEDTGPGIPSHVRAQVFQPFFQLSPTDGAGLGLAIARQLTEAMGGTVGLADDQGVSGARFVVEVDAPLAPEIPIRAPGQSLPVAAALPSALRLELLALARVGDVVALRKRAQELAADEDARAAAAAVAELASRFQLRAIRRFLGEESGHP